MRKTEAYAQEKRPLKHKLMAMALSLLMLMNIAPEYGFGLSVWAEETPPETNLELTAQRLGEWLSAPQGPDVSMLPGGEMNPELAETVFRDLLRQNGGKEPVYAAEAGAGSIYVAASTDGGAVSGDLYFYNRSGQSDFSVFVGPGFGVDEHLTGYTISVTEPVLLSAASTPEEAGEDNTLTNPDAEGPPEDGENTTEGETPTEPADPEEPAEPAEPADPENPASPTDPDAPGGTENEEVSPPAEEPEQDFEEPEESAGPDEEEEATGQNEQEESRGGDEETVIESEMAGAYVVRTQMLSDSVDGEEMPEPAEGEPEADNAADENSIPQAQPGTIQYETAGVNASVSVKSAAGGTLVTLSGVPEGQMVKLALFASEAQNPLKLAADWVASQESEDQPGLSVSFAKSEENAGTPVNVTVMWQEAPQKPTVYNNETMENPPLFDQYDSILVNLAFTPGLNVSIPADIDGLALAGSREEGFTLTYQGNRATASIKFAVGGVNDGSAVNQTYGVTSARVDYQFHVNGRNGERQDFVKSCEAATLPQVKFVGNENWTIAKSIIKQNERDYAVNAEKTEVTIRYKVEIGLGADGASPSDDVGQYDRPGRLGFDQSGAFSVVETLPAFEHNGTVLPLRSEMKLTEGENSTGVAGNIRTATGGPGETTLALDAYCVGPQKSLNNITGPLPYYTAYEVSVVYPYEKFVVPYDQEEAFAGQFQLDATAVLNYQATGLEEKHPGAKASTTVHFVEGGGSLTIAKQVREGKELWDYDYDTAQDYPGGAEFVIAPKEGSALPDGFNGKAVILPTQENKGNSVTVTLRPGTYTVAETKAPDGTSTAAPSGKDNTEPQEFTITEADNKTITFVNTAQDRGALQFTKTGDNYSGGLPGAVFQIVDNADAANVKEATSDSKGMVIFRGLKPGTYTITEKEAPTGYRRWTGSLTAEVKSGETTTVTGIPNNELINQTLTITKKILPPGGAENDIRDPRDAAERGKFTFAVRQKDQPGFVRENLKLNDKGQLTVTLPAYNEQTGEPIAYEIVETAELPYMPVSENGVTAVPAYQTGKAWAAQVVNTYGGTLSLQKKVAEYGGTTRPANKDEFTFELYQEKDGKLTQVNIKNASGSEAHQQAKTDSSGRVTAYGLSPTETYYWHEVQSADAPAYKVFYGSSESIDPIDGKTVVPAGKADLNAKDVIITNVPVEGQLVVTKEDGKGNRLKGAEFAVYKGFNEKEGEPVVRGTTDANGVFTATLPKGDYTLLETKAPEGYSIGTNGQQGFTIDDTNYNNANKKELTVQNDPFPSLSVTKTLTGLKANEINGKVTFGVYTDAAAANRAQDADGKEATITVTLNKGKAISSKVSLRPKDDQGNLISYWVKELEVPTTNGIPLLLKDEKVYSVPALTGDQSVAITNATNFAKVQIKKTDESGNPLGGVKIRTHNNEKYKLSLFTDAENGLAEFMLPVYNAENAEMTYVFFEEAGKEGYIPTDVKFSVTMPDITSGAEPQTITKGQVVEGNTASGDLVDLHFINKKAITIKAEKTVTGWSDKVNNSNGKPQRNAVLGLYAKNEDGSYTLMNTATTGGDGQVSFTTDMNKKPLPADREYVIFEVFAPDGTVPETGEAILAVNGAAPETISGADAVKYYHVPFKKDEKAALRNMSTWAQFKVVKHDNAGKPLNLAEFKLYRQDRADSVSYDPENPGELVGTYYSGYTVGDKESLRADGVIYTDQLAFGDVYWLVETTPPPGYSKEDLPVYALVPDEGVTVAAGAAKIVYKPHDVTEIGPVVNQPDNGEASGEGKKHAYAAVIVDKVLAGNPATALSDVTLELWLADASGGKMLSPMDTMVTGKDAINGSLQPGRAISSPINLQELYNQYHVAGKEGDPLYSAITKTEGEDGNPTYKANFIIREAKAPDGVLLSTQLYKLTIDTAAKESQTVKIDKGTEGDVVINMTYTNDNKKPIENTSANGQHSLVVRKYGYQPTTATVGKTDAELEALVPQADRTPLDQVTFDIYGSSGNLINSITTDATGTGIGNGNYHFTLPNGNYSLVERDSKWTNQYKNTHKEKYPFTINGAATTITLFNPAVPQLRITKNGGAVTSGVEFTVNDEKAKAPTGDSKYWSLGVEAGDYTIWEKVTSGDLTGQYFPDEGVQISVNVEGVVTLVGDPQAAVKIVNNVVDITNPAKGNLTIKKTDETGTGIEGAKFALRYVPFNVSFADGEMLVDADGTPHDAESFTGKQPTKTVAIPAGGTITEKLDPGWYQIIETEAPENYTLDSTPQYVKVEAGQTVKTTFVNKAHGTLSLTKEMIRSTEIPDAPAYPGSVTFKVYPASAENPDQPDLTKPQKDITVTIGGDGKGTTTGIRLPDGTYFLQEVLTGDAAKNWRPDPTRMTGDYVKITVSGANSEFTVKNVPAVASLTLKKVRQDDPNTPIPGAEFTLYGPDGNALGVMTTNDSGEATWIVPGIPTEGLVCTLKETKTPDAYLPPAEDAVTTVTLLPGQALKPTADNGLIITNSAGVVLDVTKYAGTAAKPGAAIDDVYLSLYRQTGGGWEKVAEKQTEGGGKATFGNLPEGVYAIQEGAVPEAYQKYQLESVVIEGTKAEQDAAESTRYVLGQLNVEKGQYSAAVYNRPPQKLTITKQELGVDDNPQARASYLIYQVDGPDAMPSEGAVPQKTRQMHSVEIQLQPGHYYVVEDTSTHQIDPTNPRTPTAKHVTIEEGTDAQLTFVNAPKAENLSVTLTKTAMPDTAAGSPMDEEQKVVFELDGFAPGTNEISPDSLTVDDQGLTFFSDEAGTQPIAGGEYRIDKITVGGASYDVYNEKGEAAKSSDVRVALSIDGGAPETRDLPTNGYTVPVSGKTFSVTYTAGGAKLGPHFTAGKITVEMTVARQQGGENTTPIRSVKNTAQASLTAGGVQKQSDKVTAAVKFPWDDSLPRMNLVKASSVPGSDLSQVGGRLTYTITLSNEQNNGKSINLPVIVDCLPNGVSIVKNPDGSLYNVVNGQTPSSSELSADGKYWKFAFAQPLAPGENITLSYTVEFQSSIMDGSESLQATNWVYATSMERLTPHAGNPLGMSFTGPNGGAGLTYDGEHAEYINQWLSAKGEKFGYLTNSCSNSVAYKDGGSLVKEVTTGTSRGIYYKDENTAKAALGDTITYKLTLINGGDSPLGKIRIGDVLPRVGDGRSSQWRPEYIPGSVSATATSGGNPTPTVTYTDEPAYSASQMSALLMGAETLSGGDGAEKASAILLDFGDFQLPSHANLVITFQMKVDTYTDASNPTPLYSMTTNKFWAYYQNVNNDHSLSPALLKAAESNPASVVLQPESVAVGGQFWIDENADGILQPGELANQDLAEAVAGSALRLTPTGQASVPVEISADGSFYVDELTAAKPKDNGVLYSGNTLLPGGLIGNPATTYSLSLTKLPGKFSLTTPYGGDESHMRSVEANKLTDTGKNVSHFKPGQGTSQSEQFFLWSAENGTDTYKNIGFVRYRDVEVHKTDAVTGEALEGAVFNLYGPFETGEITSGMLTSAKLADTQTTDTQGNLTFGDTLYYQYYVIEEAAAAANYTPTGATAQNGVVKVDGREAWIVPKGAGDKAFSQLNVENRRGTAGLTIQKVVEGSAVPEDTFTFRFTVDSTDYILTPEQVTGGVVTAQGELQLKAGETASITGLPVGASYYVTETGLPVGYGKYKADYAPEGAVIRPDVDGEIQNHVIVTNYNDKNGKVHLGAQKMLEGRALTEGEFQFLLEGEGQNQTKANDAQGNVRFDEITYTRADAGKTFHYTIREVIPGENERKGVTYDETIHKVAVTVTLDPENGDIITSTVYDENAQSITFLNTYGAAGQLELGALKKTEGAELKEGQFSFLLTEVGGDGYSDKAVNKADGSVIFKPIAYNAPGQHEYTITEESGHEYGYTYDQASYTVHVTVTDPGNGVLEAVATMDGKGFEPADALFVNRFKALSLDLYKYRQGNTSRYINGAEFTLYAYDEKAALNRGALIGTETTANGGRLRFENLEAGRYILVETYVPRGYQILQSQYDVTISNDGDNKTLIELPSGERYASVRDHTLYVPNRYRSGGGGGDDDDDNGGGGGGGGGGGRGNNGGGGEQPLTQIPEPAVPLAPGPQPLTEIPDEDVPLGALPNTGGFPVGAFAVIGGLLALLGIKVKRRKQEE